MDHPFLVGKSLFDMGESDLRELWAAEIQPHEYNDVDWSVVESALQPKSQVVLNDKLMSEALVSSDVPVKEEHSYCSQLDTVCSSPLHSDLVRSDDEDDLLSTVDCQNIDSPCVEDAVVVVEAEPFIEPCSPISSCPSPTLKISRRNYNSSDDCDSKPNSKSLEKIDKKPSSSLTTGKTVGGKRKRPISVYTSPHVNVPASHPRFPLPPTPPSCASSDNEGNVSPLYPSLPTPNVFTLAATTTRQPIHTSLISNLPKGSTGVLSLTEEEKRTLIAEGYPIPSSLPLTKAEEKCLKKIRRKIKNKISAQESRRKKKEYVDTLEKKVQFLSSENNMFRRRIHHLESNNTDLSLELTQMKRCRSMLEAQNSQH